MVYIQFYNEGVIGYCMDSKLTGPGVQSISLEVTEGVNLMWEFRSHGENSDALYFVVTNTMWRIHQVMLGFFFLCRFYSADLLWRTHSGCNSCGHNAGILLREVEKNLDLLPDKKKLPHTRQHVICDLKQPTCLAGYHWPCMQNNI